MHRIHTLNKGRGRVATVYGAPLTVGPLQVNFRIVAVPLTFFHSGNGLDRPPWALVELCVHIFVADSCGDGWERLGSWTGSGSPDLETVLRPAIGFTASDFEPSYGDLDLQEGLAE